MARLTCAHPIIAVDRTCIVAENQVKTMRYVSANEEIFVGHYPHYPIFPGVFLFEIVQQSIEIWAETLSRHITFKGVRRMRLLNAVLPGDCVVTTIDFTEKDGLITADCTLETADQKAAVMKLAYEVEAIH